MKFWLRIISAYVAVLATASPAAVSEPKTITQDAPIALLVDANTGQVLYSRNADRRFIPASITKIMTAYVAFEMIASGKLTLDQQYSLSQSSAEDWYRTGSTMFLEPGEQVSVDTLLRGITAVSANDASIVLAEGAAGSVGRWVERMNVTAASLGMTNTHFGTPNGWPDDGRTFTTADDLARLARALIEKHPDLYARYFGKDGFRHNGFAQANYDPISGVVDGADGIKTGYTNQAGHGFVGSAERDGTRLIMVVGAVDEEDKRANISREFISWGFDGFQRSLIFQANEKVGSARVQNGDRSAVTLVAAKPLLIAVPKTASSSPTYRLRYEGPLEAPITAGDEVAYLEMVIDRKVQARIPVVAAEDVARAGFFRRILNAFQSWFA